MDEEHVDCYVCNGTGEIILEYTAEQQKKIAPCPAPNAMERVDCHSIWCAQKPQRRLFGGF
jgi:hypothetical protein